MKFLRMILLSVACCSVNAQQTPRQWELPKNVFEVCRNLENSIISTYQLENEAARAIVNPQTSNAERSEASATLAAARRAQKENEDTWYKFNCTYLLYKK